MSPELSCKATCLKERYILEPPKEAKTEGKLFKLKKSCYWLYDASRNLFLAVKEQLVNFGMKSISSDEAMFVMVVDGTLESICILHVDFFHKRNFKIAFKFTTQFKRSLHIWWDWQGTIQIYWVEHKTNWGGYHFIWLDWFYWFTEAC